MVEPINPSPVRACNSLKQEGAEFSPGIQEDITVIIVSLVGGVALDRCIDAVRSQGMQVLALAGTDVVRDLGPHVTLIGSDGLTVPERRKKGIELSKASIVAILEDTTIPAPGWGTAIRESFSNPEIVAAGGPISLSQTLRARYLALGYCEYGRFQSQWFESLKRKNSGEDFASVSTLPGNNFAFRRSKLLNVLDSLEEGLIDAEVFARLIEGGGVLAYNPAMAASYEAQSTEGASLAARYYHGQAFGGRRLSGRSFFERGAFAIAALALPFLLTARTFRQLPATHRFRPGLLAWILLMQTAWSLGEAAGYLAGSGDTGLRRWR